MLGNDIEKAELFLGRARKFAQALRYGPVERRLIFCGFGFLIIAESLVMFSKAGFEQPLLHQVKLFLFAAGGVFLVLALIKLWKRLAAPLPVAVPPSPAIKGPRYFGPDESELFSRLGREKEIASLRNWILDDQVPIIAVMGESGVGKTSLVRAGITFSVKDHNIPVTYWEAVPTDSLQGLQRAIRLSTENVKGVPSATPELQAHLGGRVIVVDQMEQVLQGEPSGIFSFLKNSLGEGPPYRTKWVVAFRRSYMPVWQDFLLSLPKPERDRVEMLSLKGFSSSVAQRVVATLAEEAKLPFEHRLVDELIEGISQDGKVSPADIGISLLVLSDISDVRASTSLSARNLRELGGGEGLFASYLERVLGTFMEVERRDILKALLALIDLDHDVRIAEGCEVERLVSVVAPISSSRFKSILDHLASAKVRIIEILPASEGEARIRLIHEKLIPAIRRLAGETLAEVDRARLVLDRGYRAWLQDRSTRYLLSGSELRDVLRHRSRLPWGERADGKIDFVRRSVRRRFFRRIAASLFLVVLFICTMGAWRYIQDNTARTQLVSWGLPADLYDYQGQLEALTVDAPVRQLNWLDHRSGTVPLRRLELGDARLVSLHGLPPTLTALSLGVWEADVTTDLRSVPRSVTDLRLAGLGIKSLGGLNRLRKLRRLELSFIGVRGTPVFPESLTQLSVANSIAPSPVRPATASEPSLVLSALPPKLRELSVMVTFYGNPPSRPPVFDRIPKSLRILSVYGYTLGSALLPPNLHELSVTGSALSNHRELPRSLSKFRCEACDLRGVPIPEGVKALFLAGTQFETLDSLPSGLRELALVGYGVQSQELRNLPSRLEAFSLRMGTLDELPAFPAGLRRLDLAYTKVANPDLETLPKKLENLDLSGWTVDSFEFAPPGVRTLIINRFPFSRLKDGCGSFGTAGSWGERTVQGQREISGADYLQPAHTSSLGRLSSPNLRRFAREAYDLMRRSLRSGLG